MAENDVELQAEEAAVKAEEAVENTEEAAQKAEELAEKTEVVAEKADELAKQEKASTQKAGKAVQKTEEAVLKTEDEAQAKGGIGLLATILLALVCFIIGALLGMFVLKNLIKVDASSLAGKTTLSEAELDSPVASFVYNGEQRDVSAREAILSASSLEAMLKDDGSYALPGADTVLAYVRNEILQKEVEAHGIKVSDADVTAYAEEYMGTSDFSAIAAQYGMTEEQVKETMEQSCGTRKLYDEVVEQPDATMPDAPATPEEGKESEASAQYGEYIVNLLGDEWDAEKNTWAREDGPYYAALSSETFSKDSATYSQAESAYYVAYSEYSQQASNASSAWTEYVNGLLSNASVDIFSLVS